MRSTLLLAALPLVACSAPKRFAENHDALASARQALDAGQAEDAQEQLEALVADLRPEAKDYELQLLYAAGDLATAQVVASLGSPFLSAGPQAGNARELAEKAHLVAALWWTSFGEAFVEAAGKTAPIADGQPLVPDSMSDQDVDTVAMKLVLIELYVNARLGFDSRVDGLAGRHAELVDHERAAGLMESAQLPAAALAWINWALFEHLSEKDAIEAYRFGIAARAVDKNSLGRGRRAQIVSWIKDHPDYEWRSSAGTLFDEGSDRCFDTGEPNIEFSAYPKGN